MGLWASPVEAMTGVVLVPAQTLGSAVDLGVVQDGYVLWNWIVVHSGDAWEFGFQGSVDSSNWYDIGGDEHGTLGGSGITETMGPFVTVGTTPARYVRLIGDASTGSPVLSGLVSQRMG